MRGVCLASVMLVAIAHAEPPKLAPKPATPDYSLPALRLFLEARRADLEGLPGGSYWDSLLKSKQANTYFNIAERSLRDDNVATAVENFKHYLELVKDPPIEKLVATLENGEATITIGGRVMGDTGDDVDAIVLVDGAIAGQSPATLHPSPGEHWIERITAHSYEGRRVHVRPGNRSYVDLTTAVDKATGNVLITGMSHHDTWTEGSVSMVAGHRFTLPKGHYVIGPGAGLCKTLAFDVTTTTATTYVQVVGNDDRLTGNCFGGDRTIVHALAIGGVR